MPQVYCCRHCKQPAFSHPLLPFYILLLARCNRPIGLLYLLTFTSSVFVRYYRPNSLQCRCFDLRGDARMSQIYCSAGMRNILQRRVTAEIVNCLLLRILFHSFIFFLPRCHRQNGLPYRCCDLWGNVVDLLCGGHVRSAFKAVLLEKVVGYFGKLCAPLFPTTSSFYRMALTCRSYDLRDEANMP